MGGESTKTLAIVAVGAGLTGASLMFTKPSWTEVERVSLSTILIGLGITAWACPCDVIFRCNRDLVVLLLNAVTLWVAYRVAGSAA